MEGKRLILFMERTKPSTLWIDGDSVGTLGHIYAPHCYSLPALAPGSHHIKIRIDNSPSSVPAEIQSSHAWTDGTQTNWNGILGDFYIEATPHTYLKQVQVYPSVKEKKARIHVNIYSDSEQSGVVTLSAKTWNTQQEHQLPDMEKQVGLSKGENKIELTLDMGNRMQTWSEFHPTLYALNVTLATNEGKDNIITDFGMRDFATEGTQFTINGFKTFLRGKHDACVFPLTGYAPMDVKSWRKVFQTAKSYGINYYRCHSYTPPRAAFAAADIEGIYFQAELPLWGSISPDNHRLNDFLQNEAYMTLDYMGTDILLAIGYGTYKLTAEDTKAYQLVNSLDPYYKAEIDAANNRYCVVSAQVIGAEVYMNDSTIDWAHIINQALAVEQKDSIHYNQVTGKEMKAFFQDGDMRRVDVNGNVLIVFYPEEKDSTMIGMNYAEGSFLRIYLKDRKMEEAALIGKSNGILYPMDQIPADKMKLPSFVWFDYIRPLNKDDIFEWRGKKAGETLQKSDRKPLTSPRDMHIKRTKK